jgi:RNA polymerase sigma-70 factor (ECF subfamily)
MDLFSPGSACSARALRGSQPQPKEWREFESEALVHVGALYNVALRLSGDAVDAEDLVQEAVLKAYRSWHRYARGTNCKAWLLAILRNTFRDAYRSRSNRREFVPLESAEARPAMEAQGADDPESSFFRQWIDEEVTRAIDELPEEQRTPVVLSDLEGLTYAEIAAVMEIPVGTVRSRLFRGRRRLRRRLGVYATEMGYLKS